MGIFNKNYGHTKYANLEEVEGDKTRVVQLYTEVLKIPEKNIKILDDASYDDLDDLWSYLKALYRDASKPGQDTIFMLWFAGHGEMGGSALTQVCTNTQDPDKRLFPWEARLNVLIEMHSK